MRGAELQGEAVGPLIHIGGRALADGKAFRLGRFVDIGIVGDGEAVHPVFRDGRAEAIRGEVAVGGAEAREIERQAFRGADPGREEDDQLVGILEAIGPDFVVAVILQPEAEGAGARHAFRQHVEHALTDEILRGAIDIVQAEAAGMDHVGAEGGGSGQPFGAVFGEHLEQQARMFGAVVAQGELVLPEGFEFGRAAPRQIYLIRGQAAALRLIGGEEIAQRLGPCIASDTIGAEKEVGPIAAEGCGIAAPGFDHGMEIIRGPIDAGRVPGEAVMDDLVHLDERAIAEFVADQPVFGERAPGLHGNGGIEVDQVQRVVAQGGGQFRDVDFRDMAIVAGGIGIADEGGEEFAADLQRHLRGRGAIGAAQQIAHEGADIGAQEIVLPHVARRGQDDGQAGADGLGMGHDLGQAGAAAFGGEEARNVEPVAFGAGLGKIAAGPDHGADAVVGELGLEAVKGAEAGIAVAEHRRSPDRRIGNFGCCADGQEQGAHYEPSGMAAARQVMPTRPASFVPHGPGEEGARMGCMDRPAEESRSSCRLGCRKQTARSCAKSRPDGGR